MAGSGRRGGEAKLIYGAGHAATALIPAPLELLLSLINRDVCAIVADDCATDKDKRHAENVRDTVDTDVSCGNCSLNAQETIVK